MNKEKNQLQESTEELKQDLKEVVEEAKFSWEEIVESSSDFVSDFFE